MRDWLIDCSVRLIRASAGIDRAYQRFTRIRRELVLALASDAVLDRYNDLAYDRDNAYHHGASKFRRHLFAWEEEAISRFFPPPPARLLIGGAGGGREVFALAEKGYEVVAFERARVPVQTMAEHVSQDLPVEVYRAGYEDLPSLFPITVGAPAANLFAMHPFDAAIVGWGSFTHLRTHDLRVHTLNAFAQVTRGPVLVSFLARPDSEAQPSALSHTQRASGRYLRGRFNQDPGNVFDVGHGLFHRYTHAEIAALADRARVTIAHLSLEADESTWPYAILLPYHNDKR